MREVGADLFDGRGRHVGGEVVDAEAVVAAAELGRVARAGHVAALEADGGVGLQAVAAVAFPAVFDAGETVVVGAAAAERLAFLDRHGRVRCVGRAGEGAWVGFVGATEVGPIVGYLADGWGGSRGGRGCC